MQKSSLAALTLLVTTVAASAQLQPLNIKTGTWETTVTSTVNATMPPEVQARIAQLPPEQRARIEQLMKNQMNGTPQTRTSRKCITTADLSKVPFQDDRTKCTWNTLNSNGSVMEVHGTACQVDEGGGRTGSGEVNVSIRALNSENASGTIQFAFAGNGQSMSANSSFVSRWVSGDCTK